MSRELEIKCRIADGQEWRYRQAVSKIPKIKENVVQHNWYYAHPDLKNISVRTRSSCPESDLHCLLVQKFGDNPINGRDRVEIEIETGVTQYDLGLDLEHQGFYLESQWYRNRTTYDAGNFVIDEALNSGFGFIVELEANSRMTIEQLIDKAADMGLTVISTELMNKAYNVVAGDDSYYKSFIKGYTKYIDWENL